MQEFYFDASNKNSGNTKSFMKGHLDAYVHGTTYLKK